MNKWMKLGAVAALSVASVMARAETPEAAKALLDGAIAEVKAVGLEKATSEINAGGKWNKGTLYVVMADFNGTVLAHSANDKQAGKNMLEAKDAGGKPFVKDAIALAKASGDGKIDMRWGNPTTKKIADATLFVKRLPGKDIYVGSMVFN